MKTFYANGRTVSDYVYAVALLTSVLLTQSPDVHAQPPTTQAQAQAPVPSIVQHGDPEKAMQQAEKDVKEFRKAFLQLCKAQSVPVAVTWMYADDFEFVDLNGKKMTRTEFAQSGRVSTYNEDKKLLKEQGGKKVDLTEKQRFWRPERVEVSGRIITVYSWPVSKNIQPFPASDGSTTLKEVKVIGTNKDVFVKQANGLLRLKRQEMVDAKILVDGKPLPKEILGMNVRNVKPD